MATWKERGEVPDSEDEFAYDNDAGDDLDTPPPCSRPGEDVSPVLPPAKRDIWDIPGSSPERIVPPHTTDMIRPSTPPRQMHSTLLSSPLSEPPSDISSDPGASSTPERRRFQLAREDFRELSPDPLASDFEPPARTRPVARITATQAAQRAPLTEETKTPSLKTPSALSNPALTTVPAASQISLPTTAANTASTTAPTASPIPLATARSYLYETERQENDGGNGGLPASSVFGAVNRANNLVVDVPLLSPDEQLEYLAPRVRNFRPRKPIQERPYALENARYSNTFRSHGLRPLRLEAGRDTGARRRAADEDSQEKEFQDDSQETGDADEDTQETRLDLLLNLSQESQEDTEIDEWRVRRPSLPSTPTASMRQHRSGPSSQIGSAETPCTSVYGDADQDEFPSLEELTKAPLQQTSSSKSTKRKSLSTFSSRRKRIKAGQTSNYGQNDTPNDAHHLTPSRPSPQAYQSKRSPLLPRLILPDDMSLSPPSPTRSSDESGAQSPSPTTLISRQDLEPHHSVPVDLTAELDDSSTDESTGDLSESETRDSAAITKAGRRLRGVLPPSYLRLDEKDGKAARPRPMSTYHPFGSPAKLKRKGVAQHRIRTGDASPMRLDIFEDSDEDNGNEIAKPFARVHDSPPPMRQTALVIETDEYDDSLSAMEDNRIDPMLPTKKRQSTGSGKHWPIKRTKSNGRPALRTTQPKITSHLDIDGKPPKVTRKSATKGRSHKWHTGQLKLGLNKSAQRRKPVPRLSILDVIEPDAPKFLKIAARAARHQNDLGRSSPSNKIFQMATRWDHVDVNTVMQKWKGGHIKPHLALDAKPRKSKAKEPAQSTPRPAGAAVRKWPITKQRKLVKQVSKGGRVTYEASAKANPSVASATTQMQDESTSTRRDRPPFRPALLETTSTELSRYIFHTKKRALDNLWRRSARWQNSATPSVPCGACDDTQAPAAPAPSSLDCERPAPTKLAEFIVPSFHGRQRSRFRKNFVPKPVDVSAPQFSPANEPLPEPMPAFLEEPVEIADGHLEANKLTGLAPYGTQYTHHFEIFPLDADVFFHESTLLGSGRIDKATDNWDNERLSHPRARVSFTLDGKFLRWGPWDDQVSSELGILMDWLSDRIHGGQSFDPSESAAPLQASHFVLSYVQDSMSLPDSIAQQSFAYRVLETMKGFLERFSSDKHPFQSNARPDVIDILCRILVVVFTSNHICRKFSTLVDVQMAMEDLLIKASRITARALLSNGTHGVQSFLEDSRQVSSRQRGIRASQIVVHTWVVLMRVLEVANIPRSGFWDVVNSVLIPQDINSETDSEAMEKLWKIMFTLLPLREFDSQGVIVPGIRRLVSMDGWGLPQRLIKRVFELYKQNDRQAASFNNYCRALVSRCHYLAREWGWSNCGGIIGTIFDFFGSQHLSHLRNEEAYKSPRFLEELAHSPTLVVEREDKCFHIFLKFVALAIKRLKDRGASKEIRNLTARVVPNHSRSYLKEKPLHAHDLASLRNHHDLLCTLFWAAPRDLRPEVHLIESLIRPADAHKDACLVNLRAWSQLARYIVLTEDDDDVLRVFHQWQCNIFRQLMDQFESAASDVQQQYLALSQEDSQSISQTQIEFVVSMNKATAKEIIYACINTSRDVLPYAHSIPAATFALNTLQLGEVLRHFSVSPPTLNWAILRSALETLNAYILKVDSLCKWQHSQDSRANDNISKANTSLHRELSKSFFAAARCIIATEGTEAKSASAVVDKPLCMELITVLAARLFAGFSKAGLVNASQALGPGNYGLFGREVHKLPVAHRKYLVLFVAVLLKQGLLGVDVLGPSLIELWLLALVKPRQSLAYENQLAEELKRRNEPFVPEAVVGLSINPDYGTNRDLFEYAISWMRQSSRDAAPGTRRNVVSSFSTMLQTVMDQIKSDLRVVALDPVEHPAYVMFVRDIISLIRSHCTEICTVDEFFYQINKEYSPSVQDPRLHVAGIVAYGLRLGEGEARIAPQLFYYLFNNFKIALINNKIEDEARMLRRGMNNNHILAFVLGKMVPAISRAAVKVRGAFPLLDAYHDALARSFLGRAAGRQLTEETLPDALSLVQTIARCLYELGTGGLDASSVEQLHVARQLCSMINILWPSIEALSYTSHRTEPLCALELLLGRLRAWVDSTISHLDDTMEENEDIPQNHDLFNGLRVVTNAIPQPESQVITFQESIIADVRKNWVVSDSTITIQAPARPRGPSSTQSGQGIKKPDWDVHDLVECLGEELKLWRLRHREVFVGTGGGRRGVKVGSIAESLIF